MQVTTTSALEHQGVNCSFSYGKYHYVWEDNIKMDLQEVACGGMDRVEIVHDWERWRVL